MTTKDRVLSMIKTARSANIENATASVNPFSDNAYKAGFRKAAEAHGLDPDLLEKLAWTVGGAWDSLVGGISGTAASGINGAWEGIKGLGTGIARGWDEGDGFLDTSKKMVMRGAVGGARSAVKGVKDGWEGGYQYGDSFSKGFRDAITSKDTFDNLSASSASLFNGGAKTILSVPGLAGSVIGSLGYGFSGNGFGNGWDAGRDWVNSIGPGTHDLQHAIDAVDRVQASMKADYLARNNITPGENFVDTMGLVGFNMANAAGKELPLAIGGGKLGAIIAIPTAAVDVYGSTSDDVELSKRNKSHKLKFIPPKLLDVTEGINY